jgi:hypothetical protein
MMTPHNSKAIQEMIAVGVIPQNCQKFEMLSDAEGAVLFKYEVFATEEQVQQIADALKRNPEEAQRITRTVLFGVNDKDSSPTAKVELP